MRRQARMSRSRRPEFAKGDGRPVTGRGKVSERLSWVSEIAAENFPLGTAHVRMPDTRSHLEN